jgi:uncharacterized lipoprotein
MKALSRDTKAVQVTVVDERPSKTLGQRGARNIGASLTVEGELSTIIQSTIQSGLEQQGFKISDNGFSNITEASRNLNHDEASNLKIEIRSLDYKVISGFFSGTIRSECAVKAICKSRSGKEYEKLYNGLFEQPALVIATADENNRYVSAAVSDAIDKLLNDDKLGYCLAD